MIDDWFERIELPLSFDQFRTLPTNPSYKYEYFGGRAVLTPRPKCYQAVLDLTTVEEDDASPRPATYALRTVRQADWPLFPALFASAFHGVQPFCALEDDRRLEAASRCLTKTITGGDGPIVDGACVVAAHSGDEDRPVAGLLITLQSSAPPGDERQPLHDLPHLTWIFVPPRLARRGVGSALLARSIRSLRGLGYTRLASTFLLGNESSTLWHWRNGFTLRGYPPR